MNWLSIKEIKRRAEVSDEEALNVSIKEWEDKYEAAKRGETVRSGPSYCGLCQRHNAYQCGGDGCGNCCISDKDISNCCQEYVDFCNSKTPENAQAMLNRLYQEKGKMLCFIHLNGVTHRLGNFGSSYVSGRPAKDFIPCVTGNLTDDLKINAEDLEEFEKELADGGKLTIRIVGSKKIGFVIMDCHATGTIAEVQRVHQKLGQVIATAKRREAKKDC